MIDMYVNAYYLCMFGVYKTFLPIQQTLSIEQCLSSEDRNTQQSFVWISTLYSISCIDSYIYHTFNVHTLLFWLIFWILPVSLSSCYHVKLR